MEKILEIDGKKVGFKSTAAFLLRYRDYFGKDGLKDINVLMNADDSEDLDLDAYTVMLNMLWVLAKTYDKRIAPVEDWLDDFEDFDITYVYTEIAPLIAKSFGRTVEITPEEKADTTKKSTKKSKN